MKGEIKVKKLWEKDADYLRRIGCRVLRPGDVRASTFAVHYKGKPTGIGFDVVVNADGTVRMWLNREARKAALEEEGYFCLDPEVVK